MGTGRITYQQALTAAFIEGWIFILISLVGVRSWLLKIIPRCLLLSTSAGIGLFLAFIGLQQAEGIGLVTYNSATLVTLGGCSTEYRRQQFTFLPSGGAPFPNATDVCAVGANGEAELFSPGWVPSGNYACDSAGVMRSPTMWLKSQIQLFKLLQAMALRLKTKTLLVLKVLLLVVSVCRSYVYSNTGKYLTSPLSLCSLELAWITLGFHIRYKADGISFFNRLGGSAGDRIELRRLDQPLQFTARALRAGSFVELKSKSVQFTPDV